MRVAKSEGLSVVARGAGTKLDWGNPPASADLMVDLSLMDKVIEHEPGDLVARVQAGTTLAHLSEVLGSKGQRFPVDEVVAGSTVGGVVSTGLSGPLRYMYGAVRDLVLGITVVRADGVVAHAGSKVVKNVAGYDLAKLFTGSYGTLGILTELTLKLKPVPMAQRFVVTSCPSPGDLTALLSALSWCQAAPTAIELDQARARFARAAVCAGRRPPAVGGAKSSGDRQFARDVASFARPRRRGGGSCQARCP